ncbi:MAG: hypothetical protein IJN57_04730 [Oscillospiraceae bacterium]|nr:hypothetical protein [Oscillospiraceae bacterium]
MKNDETTIFPSPMPAGNSRPPIDFLPLLWYNKNRISSKEVIHEIE